MKVIDLKVKVPAVSMIMSRFSESVVGHPPQLVSGLSTKQVWALLSSPIKCD